MSKMKTDKKVKNVVLLIHKSLCKIDTRTKFFTMALLIDLTKIRNDNLRKIINKQTNSLRINLTFPARSTYSQHRNKYLTEYISMYKKNRDKKNFENLAISKKCKLIFDIKPDKMDDYEKIHISYNINIENKNYDKLKKQKVTLINNLAKISICKKKIHYEKSILNNIAQPNRNRTLYNKNLKKTLLDVFEATKTLHNIPEATIESIKSIYKKHFSLKIKPHITTNNFYYLTMYFTYKDEFNNNIEYYYRLILIKATHLDGLIFLRKDEILDPNEDKKDSHLTLMISDSGKLIAKYKNKPICKKISIMTLNKLGLEQREITATPLVNDQSTSNDDLIFKELLRTKQQIICFINNLERKLSIDNIAPKRLFPDNDWL